MTAGPSLSVKLGAALLALLDAQGEPIPHEHAKQMTAHQIISLFDFDHYPVRRVDGGPNAPWNLVPRLIKQHRGKTAKVDVPAIAKTRRLIRIEAETQRRLLAKITGEALPPATTRKRKIPSRGFAKGHRPLRRTRR